MLRVTIELLPFGSEVGKKTLATADIANDGSGTRNFGNYTAKLWVHQTKNGKPKLWRKATVKKFPRIARGPWDLLQLVLTDALSGRNLQNVTKDDE